MGSLDFGNFIDSESVPLEDQIQADLTHAIMQLAYSSFFSRSVPQIIAQLEGENESDIIVLEAIIKAQIVSHVATYNQSAPPSKQVIVGSEMLTLKVADGTVAIEVKYFPMIYEPSLDSIGTLKLVIPIGG